MDEDQGTNALSNVSDLVPRRLWNYGLASFDRTHVFTMNYLYDLPKTHTDFRPARVALNGWQFSGISRISGAPMTVGFTTTARHGYHGRRIARSPHRGGRRSGVAEE